LRIVTTAGRADFAPVEIIGAKNGWIYVAGLNDTQQIIVVGQDFVENGQEVDPVLLDLSASGAKS
jgi:multidrug efflux system membrane fusion protein